MAQGTLFSYFGKMKKAEGQASVHTSSKEWMKPGELVWAKMEGYPYWPAMLTNHHVDHKMLRGSKGDQECHVQFFGEPPTRGWILARDVQRFEQSTSSRYPSNTAELAYARQQAIDVLKLSCSNRLAKLSIVILSDNNDDDSSPPARKRPRYVSPRLPLSAISEEDEDIGHVETHASGRPKRAVSRSIMERQRLKKRKKQKVESDDSADDYCPDNINESSDNSCSSGVDESVANGNQSSDSSGECIDVTPSSKKSTALLSSTPRRPNGGGVPKKKKSLNVTMPSQLNSSVNTSLSSSPGGNVASSDGRFAHERLEWLKAENRKDIAGRRVSDPDYDPRTLLVPAEYFKRQTPGHKQWWKEKSKHFDAVIFFKVGKFYELYHMDAVVGVQECGLAYMKGDYAHSGFPEIAYSRYAQSLVQKGYKVARVEQTETPSMMEERIKKSPASTPKASTKVVARELCSIVTKGTITPSFLRGDSLNDTEQLFLLAITEGPANLSSSGSHTIGVCFVDTCIGIFHLGQYDDDRHLSRFRTMMSHYKPAQVLYPRQRLSHCYQAAINAGSSILKESLSPGSEFWDEVKTLKELVSGGYFNLAGAEDDSFDWPKVLEEMLDSSDPVRATVANGYQLAISALGACVWYLRQCCIDHELLSLKNFELYTPLDLVAMETNASQSYQWSSHQRMVLDGVTLNNLDVTNSNSQSQAGTLLERIDHCVTSFGRRKLYEWVCAPLCNPDDINKRLDAIETLMQHPSTVAEVKDLMKGLPDLQRLLRRVHTLGSAVRSSSHPDSRAIMYEETTYSKRKINDFLSMINGLQTAIKITSILNNIDDDHSLHDSSLLLWRLTTCSTNGGDFPNMEEQLHIFEVSFDHDKARRNGIIIPHKGVNPAYDNALAEIGHINQQLDDYLQQQRKRLNCKNIVYWGTGRNRFQLEIPENVISRHVPEEYDLKSQRKGFRRYWTQNIEQLLQQLIEMETRRDDALKDTLRTIFHSFDEHFTLWESAVNCIAVLDCLCSLAVFSSCSDGDMCRPNIVAKATAPFLEIRAGRHPCVVHTFTGNEYIPNDTLINASQHNCCLVVTGPNMGGKSTLMRQTGLIVLLAHLGCYVPAAKCRMTPVDRIFTRLGASDRITSGESTFYVELAETSTILQHATCHSLVLLDELGRGTATYDGTAIASAVVKELAEEIKCRTIFSTHYHSLVEEFTDNPFITLGHMACMVEDNDNDNVGEETITFLYKLIEGACPKSYGFNAARLAGLPTEVIKVAYGKAQQFEETANQQKLFRKVVELHDVASLLRMLEQT